MIPISLPPNTQVLERGWLSANTVLFTDDHGATAVDTGYCSHAPQTVALIQTALAGRVLNRIVNTHLHSDHCGGNTALVAQYGCEVLIPPGQAAAVAVWDETTLTFEPTGQDCPRFSYTGLVQPNDVLRMGNADWLALAAPGHDPNSLMFYCAQHRCLVSADALWENGFGVVFPELDGIDAFDTVAATLDVIAALKIDTVLPGHGGAFSDVAAALQRARVRLDGFVQAPIKHRWHAVKVLCMFWLMAQRIASCDVALAHLSKTRYIQQVAAMLGGTAAQVVQQAFEEMVAKGQIRASGGQYSPI
jgi:glyoxylase-like metal-dependent hydrolase (beta-lactamase superfamily II)